MLDCDLSCVLFAAPNNPLSSRSLPYDGLKTNPLACRARRERHGELRQERKPQLAEEKRIFTCAVFAWCFVFSYILLVSFLSPQHVHPSASLYIALLCLF